MRPLIARRTVTTAALLLLAPCAVGLWVLEYPHGLWTVCLAGSGVAGGMLATVLVPELLDEIWRCVWR